MGTNKKISTKFEMDKIELEETIKIKMDEYKSETSIYIYMKLLTLNSNKYSSSFDQPSANLIKFPLPKLPEQYSHASQFTNSLSFITLEGKTFPQIQKIWYAILSALCQYLSINKIWTA